MADAIEISAAEAPPAYDPEPIPAPAQASEEPAAAVTKRPSSNISEDNIVEGKRQRKKPRVWVHEDEADVLKNSSYDADAYEEALQSDTEIIQSDDEEEKHQIRNESVDTDDEEAIVADDIDSDDGDWCPTEDENEDEEDEDDEDEDEVGDEIAAAILVKFDEDGVLLYHTVGEDGLIIESSLDHLSERETAEVAVSSIDPDATVVVCLDDSDVRAMIERVAVFQHEDPTSERYNAKLADKSVELLDAIDKITAKSLKPIGKASAKKIGKLVEDQDKVHYFFFD